MRVSLKTKIIGLLLGLALAPILKAADKFVTLIRKREHWH